MDLEYYYNNVSGKGLCRNNLIYTSLISTDRKVFVQHYVNDTDYHKGQNQVVDPAKMNEKWAREVQYLTHMATNAPDLVPRILDIDLINKKIYLEIDGVDFWQRSLDADCAFDQILPDWQEQMLNIIKTHRHLGLYKYSMHPSSYFIVGGKLKSINYFFTYNEADTPISIADVESHISVDRQAELRKYLDQMGIVWDQPQDFKRLEQLCWDSFSNNYPADFINKVKSIL